jgi:3-oxoacyl-[acyl-carrier protein] reductase
MLGIDLAGRTALVIGGSRGIGASIVEHLCRAGAYTLFTHTGNPSHRARVEELLAAVRREGGAADAEALDARDGPAMRALADRLAGSRGRIDILVCNAGMNQARPAEALTDDEWDASIRLNLGTAFNGVRAVLPHMLRQGRGRIVFIGSSAVYDGGGQAMDYAAAKAGLKGMMIYLCRAFARRGILANTVHPCVIETDLLRQRYADAEAKAKLVAQIPAGRLGKPEDVAGLVAYLASPWGDYVCGQDILLDGGRVLFGK